MRIQTRIMSAVILVVAVVDLIYAAYFLSRERHLEMAQLQSTIAETNKLLQVVTASPLYDGNVEQLHAILDSAFANHDLIHLELTEYNGDLRLMRSQAPLASGGRELHSIGVIRWGADELGEIRATYSTARIERLFKTSATKLALFALALLLLLMGVIYLIARQISGPIERLTSSAEEMAGGQLDREITAGGDRELRSLGQSFIRLRDAIREKMADLAARNAALSRTQFSIDRARDAIFWIHPDGRFAYVNQAACNNLGYTREELLTLAVPDVDPDFPEARWREHWQEMKATGSTTIESSHRAKNGRIFPVEVAIDYMEFADEEYLSATARDISERKLAEKKIVHLNRVYALLSNVNASIVRIRDRQALLEEICRIAVEDGGFRLAWMGLLDEENRQVCVAAQFGYSPGYVNNLRLSLDDPPERREPTVTAILSAAPSICNDIAQYKLLATWRDRALAHGYRASASLPLKVFGQVIGTLNLYSTEEGFFKDSEIQLLDELATDISFAFEFMEHEEEQQKLASVIEASSDLIGIADLEGNLLYLNAAGRKLVGLESIDPVLRTSARQFLLEQDYDRYETEILPALLQSGSWSGELAYRHFKTGATIPVEMNAFMIRDTKTGQPVALANISRDLTERKQAQVEQGRLEAQLLQAQKMESVGRLAGGVAHDTNNMLSVVLGYADLLKYQLPEGDPMAKGVEEIIKAAMRSRDLTRQLLAFSRQQIINPQPVQLNDLVADTQKSLVRLIGEDIDIRFHAGKNLWTIRLDPIQVDQILLNLAVNARDAMPDGGILTIETANVHHDEAYCRNHLEFLPGDFVQLMVSDNGVGMDQATLDYVFEPFFTTKEVGKGTGLGLATVYGIVKQNHGFINVYSEPGQGTTFRIYFPRISGQNPDLKENVGTVAVAAGTGTILLVEDDGMVRTVASALLENLGYTVLMAETPQEALDLLQKETPIDLLLTDVVMPGMKGTELRDRAREILPAIKVLFMSGYTSNVIVHHGVLQEGVHFIEKPFNQESLARKVREAMAD